MAQCPTPCSSDSESYSHSQYSPTIANQPQSSTEEPLQNQEKTATERSSTDVLPVVEFPHFEKSEVKYWTNCENPAPQDFQQFYLVTSWLAREAVQDCCIDILCLIMGFVSLNVTFKCGEGAKEETPCGMFDFHECGMESRFLLGLNGRGAVDILSATGDMVLHVDRNKIMTVTCPHSNLYRYLDDYHYDDDYFEEPYHPNDDSEYDDYPEDYYQNDEWQ